MGFFDDLSGMLNRGTEAASRMADTANLKIKLASLDSRHKDLAAQLGESLYAQVMADPALSAGREQLLADLSVVVNERAQVRAEIERIERQAEAAKAANMVYACPNCGTTLQSHMRFCPSCGTPIAMPQEPATQPQQPGFQSQPAPEPVYTQVNVQPAQPVEPQDSVAPQQPQSAPVSQVYEMPQQDNQKDA